MKTKNTRKNVLALVETAMMVALAVGLELLCKFLPQPWAYGGSISLGAIPIIYLSYRRGWKWGISAGFVYASVQMLLGLSLPPANTFAAVALCILLDYVIAFSVLGLAGIFAAPFERSGKPATRIAGYITGAVGASLLRFICSFISGIILWESYTPEGMNVWVYSLVYNGSYMLGNAAIAAVVLALLCSAVDPKTLKPMKKV
ncbi:MAG: energy-coupled thiamine transporter ThiT [Clostridia bacterium]|nr:energy-coupled thiamine transporter ThiT [Clostridia bacterium]